MVTLLDQGGYIVSIGGEDRGQPAIHQIGGLGHLHVELAEKRHDLLCRRPIVADDPLIDREYA